MQQYASTIIYICIFAVIIELILPENKMKKYIGVLSALIVTLTLISPIIKVLNNNDVIDTISTTLDNIQSNVEIKQYEFENLQNGIIFTSVKEDLEDEIYNSCKEKFDAKFGISKVKITIGEDYHLEDINIYIKRITEIADVSEIIDYIANHYDIDVGIINVIKE